MTHAALGFPVWIRATYWINVLFIGFLIRAGIQILAAVALAVLERALYAGNGVAHMHQEGDAAGMERRYCHSGVARCARRV